MLPPARTFRVFVSSTFTDLKAEREALHNLVFPAIRRFCEERGARFDAVDLRWGISEQAGRDHRTMRVCLEEVRRCRETTPRPNFLVLLGDRYGWTPLPAEVPSEDFVRIHEAAIRIPGSVDLASLYPQRDTNANPPVSCLRPRGEQSKDEWHKLERRAVALIRTLAHELNLSAAVRAACGGSATEQEIYEGLLKDDVRGKAARQVHAFLREVGDPPGEESARLVFDYVDGELDGERRDAARLLKEELRINLPEPAVHKYRVDWVGTALDTAYLGNIVTHARTAAAGAGSVTTSHPAQNLCQDFYDAVTGIIEQELGERKPASSIEAEVSAHEEFAKQRGDDRTFTGRKTVLDQIHSYIDGEVPAALAVIGPSGSGKSAVIARALLDRRKQPRNEIVIARFIGVTPDSSEGRALLAGLNAEIAAAYGRPEPPPATDFAALVAGFQEALKLPAQDPQARRLVIFLDALDQLSELNREHELRWLPLNALDAAVRLIVSVAADRPAAAEVRNNAPQILDLPGMPDSEGTALLRVWLSRAGRTLEPPQELEIRSKFEESGLPLYLRFAFEQARAWRSFDRAPDLPPDVSGIIHQTFRRLSEEGNHGQNLVRTALTVLAAAREGLTEDEILGLLWLDSGVRESFDSRFPESPQIGSLPRVVWSLLYYDLKPYLTERNANGVSVLSFFHRAMKEASVSAYLPEDYRPAVHSRLAAWFTPATEVGAGAARFGIRSLTELPYQLRRAGMWQELQNTLCDFSFIEAKCAAGLVYDLLADYDAAVKSKGLSNEQRGVISGFSRFVRAYAHLLATHPGLALQQALNEPDSGIVQKRAAGVAVAAPSPYFRHLNKPQTASACVLTLFGHSEIVSTCNFSPDGSKIVSGAGDGEIRIWDTESGQLLIAFRNHDASVEYCSFCSDGSLVFSAMRDGVMQFSDAKNGRLVRTLPGEGSVPVCRLTKDNRRMIRASWDGTVTLWDLDSDRIIRTYQHPKQVYTCDFSPDEKSFASGAADGVLRIWDVETGKLRTQREAHTQALMDCRFSADGKFLFTTSQDSKIKRWNVEAGEPTGEPTDFEGHQAPVWAIALSDDGSRVVSSSQDGAVFFWNAETGDILARTKEHVKEVWGLALSTKAGKAVSGSWDMTLKVWSMEVVEEIARAAGELPVTVEDSGGHWGYMIPCSCSPDGKYYAAGSSDTTVRVWEAASGRSLGVFPIHSDYVFCCAFSSDSRWLISGGWSGAVKLLEIGSWKVVDLPGHADYVLAAGFLDRDRSIFTCSTDGIRISAFDGQKAVETSFWTFDSKPATCVFRGAGDWFAACLESGAIEVVYPRAGNRQRFLDTHPKPSCCALSPAGDLLVTGSEHGTIRFWDVASKRALAEIHAYDVKVVACNFSRDGRRVVVCSWDAVIKVFDATAPGDPLLVLRGHTDQMQDACFTPDGTRIVSVSLDGTLRLWDSGSGAFLGSVLYPADCAPICGFHPNGSAAITASHHHSVKVWDSASGGLQRVLGGHKDAIHACAFSPQGTLVTASGDGTLLLWNIQSGKAPALLQGHEGPVRCCAFSPDGSFIASGSWDKTVRVWDAATGSPVRVLSGHDAWVSFVFVLPDGRIASCDLQGGAIVWDWETGAPVRMFRNEGVVSAAAVSPGGSRLVTGCEDGVLRIWDLNSGSLSATLEGHAGGIRQCAVAGAIASASMDGTVRLWDWSGAAAAVFKGHAAPVLACAYTSSGRCIVSGGEDQFVRVWDPATGAQIAEYWARTAVESVTHRPGTGFLGVGDRQGKFHLIELLGPGAGLV